MSTIRLLFKRRGALTGRNSAPRKPSYQCNLDRQVRPELYKHELYMDSIIQTNRYVTSLLPMDDGDPRAMHIPLTTEVHSQVPALLPSPIWIWTFWTDETLEFVSRTNIRSRFRQRTRSLGERHRQLKQRWHIILSDAASPFYMIVVDRKQKPFEILTENLIDTLLLFIYWF